MTPFSVATPAVTRVLDKLHGVKSAGSGRWMAKCPSHEDREASLSVKVGDKSNVVMYCHAGCDKSAIVGAIGLTLGDLFDEKLEPAPQGKAQGVNSRPVMVKSYDYTDADGTLLYQVCRFEPKTFRQRRPEAGGKWAWGLGTVTPVLYRLPEVIEAVSTERRVFLVEGEKDADALTELGYVATTAPMGAGKWRESFTAVLKGGVIVILPDNDEPGMKHAEQVAASLHSAECSVRIVKLPGLPPKGDVSDWLPTGDLDALEALIGVTPRWSPEGLEAKRRTRWRLDELWENDSIMRPPPAIVPRLAWSGRSTLLAAREKSGKSTLTGYIAAMVTRGGLFLGDPCASGDVLIVGLEEFLGDAARRLKHFGAVPNKIHLVDSFAGEAKARPDELMQHIDAVDPVLVVLDSLAAYGQGLVQDDNNASQMSAVVQPLTDMAHTRGVALIIVHHARKADGRARGSTAITAGTDVVVEFFCPDENVDPTMRRMRTAGRVPVQPVYDLRFDGRDYVLANQAEAPLEARVINTVQNRPGIGVTDLTQSVAARKEDVSRCVTDLLAKGTLVNLSDSLSRMRLTVSGNANLAFLGGQT